MFPIRAVGAADIDGLISARGDQQGISDGAHGGGVDHDEVKMFFHALDEQAEGRMLEQFGRTLGASPRAEEAQIFVDLHETQ